MTRTEKLQLALKENYRSHLSEDPKFIVAKQRFMQPVFDFRTGDKVNYRSKLTWLADMIT